MKTGHFNRLMLLSLIVGAALSMKFSCQDDVILEPSRIAIQGVAGQQNVDLEQTVLLAPGEVEAFTISRLSFYLSDIELVNPANGIDSVLKVSDVSFVELDASGQASITLEADLDRFDYEFLQFRLGLREDQDRSTPAEHPAGHPLARTSEYWVDWGSYIFLKIEGRADTLADDRTRFDSPILYHLGRSPEMARTYRIPLTENFLSEGTLLLDIYELLGVGGEEPVPLRGAVDHQNRAGNRIMQNAQRAFRAR